jgi:hypothetical protein
MPGRAYQTVPEELLPHADVAVNDFQNRGFRVHVERDELGFPYTPTFLCKRGNTTIIVEVDSKIRIDRLEAWVRYGSSCSKDTRVALCLPHALNVSTQQVTTLRQRRIGLYHAFPDRLEEHMPPADLAFNVQLPEPNSIPKPLRKILGSAYEQFARTQWREGFEEACQALESEARRYLNKWSKTGRIKVLRKGVPITLATNKINSMTMGQLANAFRDIQAQNHADTIIGKALTKINRDRVGVAHHKARPATERRLRTNVGQHIWTIVAALKEMI